MEIFLFLLPKKSSFKCTVTGFYCIHTVVQVTTVLILEPFHRPRKELHAHQQSPPFLTSSNLLSCFLSLDFPIVDISCEWSRALYGLLYLASFTKRLFKAHPGCATCLSLITFVAEQRPLNCIVFVHLAVDGHLGSSHLLAVVNNTAPTFYVSASWNALQDVLLFWNSWISASQWTFMALQLRCVFLDLSVLEMTFRAGLE